MNAPNVEGDWNQQNREMVEHRRLVAWLIVIGVWISSSTLYVNLANMEWLVRVTACGAVPAFLAMATVYLVQEFPREIWK